MPVGLPSVDYRDWRDTCDTLHAHTQTLGKLEATKKVLLVETAENRNLELSARNLEGVVVVRSHEVNPYMLLDATRVLLTQAAASKLSETLAKSAPRRSEAK